MTNEITPSKTLLRLLAENIGLSQLPLRNRVKNVLERNDIKNLRQILELTEGQFLDIPGIASKARDEMNELLTTIGLPPLQNTTEKAYEWTIDEIRRELGLNHK